MKHLLRPYRKFHVNPGFAALVRRCSLRLARRAATRPMRRRRNSRPSLRIPAPSLSTPASAGYLGVDVADVDADKAQALKLKEVRGAVITLIDHDAPAGQIGLKVNDVVLGINGQNVDGAEQLRRMLREIPPGRKISLEISRDGNIQTLAVQLVDRKAHGARRLGQDRHRCRAASAPVPPLPAMGIMGGGDAPCRPAVPHVDLHQHPQRGRAG